MKAKTATSIARPVGRRRPVQGNAPLVQAPASAGQQAAARIPVDAIQTAASASALGKILGVYADPLTWGAAFFILVSLVTGIIYFTWAVTGLALSVSFLILIIGLPFAFVFLLSVRGLALVEARLVGAALGMSIAPAPLFGKAGSKWWERLKALVADRNTWSALLYLVLQMPLGVIYFSVTVSLVALALGLISAPLLYVLTPMPVIMIESQALRLPIWAPVLTGIAGFLLLTAAMHIIRGIGRWHGRRRTAGHNAAGCG